MQDWLGRHERALWQLFRLCRICRRNRLARCARLSVPEAGTCRCRCADKEIDRDRDRHSPSQRQRHRQRQAGVIDKARDKDHFRAQREHLARFSGLLSDSPGQTLASTVLYAPSLLDSGTALNGVLSQLISLRRETDLLRYVSSSFATSISISISIYLTIH